MPQSSENSPPSLGLVPTGKMRPKLGGIPNKVQVGDMGVDKSSGAMTAQFSNSNGGIFRSFSTAHHFCSEDYTRSIVGIFCLTRETLADNNCHSCLFCKGQARLDSLTTERDNAMALRLSSDSGKKTGAKVFSFNKLKECVQVVVQNGELCLKLPVVGDVCVDIPDEIPDGTAAEACAELGFPACVHLTVKVAGKTVVDKKFGAC